MPSDEIEDNTTQVASLPLEMLQVFETLPDLYLVLSPDLIILTASNAYLKATFKEREAIQGKYLFEVFPDNPALPDADATANLKRSLEWVLQQKQPHQMPLQRYDVTQSDALEGFKEKYWLATNTPVLDSKGKEKVQYIIHRAEEVTEQVMAHKREEYSKLKLAKLSRQQVVTNSDLVSARAEADRQRDKLHTILMQAPALICILEGPQHVYKLVNPPYQQVVGDRPLLGKPIAEAMPELAGQSIFGLLDQVYRTGESYHTHEMLVQLDHDNSGSLGNNYYHFTYQATRDTEGNTNGIMVFAYEVTAQVEARQKVEQREQALKELNAQLAAANGELSQTQQALRDLNRELEERVIARTRELELAQAETEAERSRLHSLFMQAPAPICILEGPQLVYELVNPAYQQLFPGRVLLGKPVLEALPEITDQPIHASLQNVYQTGGTSNGKEVIIQLARYEGSPLEELFFNFTFQARYDSNGQVIGIIVFAFEITDQVRARRAVEQSAERLKLLTDALPVLIGYLDQEEKYRFANQAYEAWFSQNPEELLGRPLREVVGEEAYQGVKGYIERALAGERLDFEARMPYRENFTKHIRTSYVPDIQQGKVVGFYTLVTDVTEQVEARLKIEDREKKAQALTVKLAATNEELSTANEQLTRTNIDLDNFIYAASHDLKVPILNIEGLTQLLIDSLSPQVLASLGLEGVMGMITDSIDRFKRTIDHMTEVTKLQKENNQETVVVDLAEVIREVRLDLSPQLETAEAELEIDIDTCPRIRSSKKNLRSVVYNLLSNAVKYRSPERTPRVQIRCRLEGEYAVLSVRDNGLGMNLDENHKLFTMFGRLHDHVDGTGIGLYMVKKIVENAEGRIEVESEVGVGTTFTVYFKN